ncbi:reverse transcriptase domain-containing protein [Tanacetum coccineum]
MSPTKSLFDVALEGFPFHVSTFVSLDVLGNTTRINAEGSLKILYLLSQCWSEAGAGTLPPFQYRITRILQTPSVLTEDFIYSYLVGFIPSTSSISVRTFPYSHIILLLIYLRTSALTSGIVSLGPLDEWKHPSLIESRGLAVKRIIELEDHVPVYIPEPEHPKDLVPAEDEAPTPLLPPFFLSPRIRPLCTRAVVAQMKATAPSTYHSLLLSGTLSLLPIPLPAPSTSRRADIPEADTPPRKRLLLTTPRPSCEVGESSAVAAARQPGPTMAHRVDYSLVDTMETRFRDTERRMMTALEMVNMRVSYQVDVRSRESSEFYSRHHDAQKDRAAVTAEIEHVTQPGMALTAILRERVSGDLNALLESALTWWNSHVMTVTHDVAYAMTWVDLRKKMTDKYCPRNEMKKLEAELWNLKVIGTDVVKYNQRFQELALLCVRMFPEESDKIERYVGGLPDTIHGNIVASRPKTMQEAVEMATELMDKKNQQQQNKRQNTARHTCRSGDKKQYGGSRPLCSKCNYHHDGPCAPKCYKCNKFGHIARDCMSAGNANNTNNQKGTGSGQRPTCFECGVQGHFRKECPKLKNNKGNRGNQDGRDTAPAKVYAVGRAGKPRTL